MSDAPKSFAELLAAVRAGDPAAAEELHRRYEPYVRAAVRVRLTDPRLRRVLDSADLCQSVMASFFTRAAVGQYDLTESADLIRLLVRIAQNKVAEAFRFHTQQQRDVGRVAADPNAGDALAAGGPGPDRLAAYRELLAVVYARLEGDERRVAELRAGDASWRQVADAIGGTPEAARKLLARALNRIGPGLGLATDDDDE